MHERASFNLLQNYGSARAPLHFFVFDVLILKGEEVMNEPLVKRRQLLEKHVLPKLAEPIRYSPILEGRLKDLIHSVKAQRLEGLISLRLLPGTGGATVFANTGSGTNHPGFAFNLDQTITRL